MLLITVIVFCEKLEQMNDNSDQSLIKIGDILPRPCALNPLMHYYRAKVLYSNTLPLSSRQRLISKDENLATCKALACRIVRTPLMKVTDRIVVPD